MYDHFTNANTNMSIKAAEENQWLFSKVNSSCIITLFTSGIHQSLPVSNIKKHTQEDTQIFVNQIDSFQ